MQTAEIIKYHTSTEWAVVSYNRDMSRGEDWKNIRPDRVSFGKRVNGLKYDLNTTNGYSRTSTDPNDFSTSSERSAGFLMEFQKSNGDIYYAVIKPAHFLTTRIDYDKYWIPEMERIDEENRIAEERRRIEQERLDKKRNIEIEKLAQARPQAEHTAEVIAKTIQRLIGNNVSRVEVNAKGTWVGEDTPDAEYFVEQIGQVSLSLKDFQRLLEKAVNA